MDENLKSNQILVDITREDGSKGKISYFNSPHHQNKTRNSTTAKSGIFRGVFENKIFVCVRRFVKAQISNTCEGIHQFQRDIDVLQEPQHLHENFIRYLCNEQDTNFFYVATEWCICSVEDLYGRNAINENWAKEKIESGIIKKSLGKKELLRQATEGLAFLHALGFVHRNLKPSNFLIAQLQQFRGFRYLIKLSDFRLSKDPVENPNDSGTIGSNGWTYPKKLDYFSGDVFILGCFFHYVLTDGEHPFGDSEYVREENIKKENCEWLINSKIDKNDQNAVSLLKKMIRFNLQHDNCTLEDVFKSSYFSPINFYKLYDLPDVKPGLCVIFNQEIFADTRNNRNGSDKDEDSLKYVFLEFGFDVRVYKDLKAEVLYCCISELAREDFSSYASLVVCILSHGNEDVVEGVDGKNIKINELKYKFNSNDCPTLSGKPKIWIIEACQGKEIQNPMQPNGSQRSGAYSKPDSSGNDVSQEIRNEFLIPNKRQKVENPMSRCKNQNSPEDKLNQRPPLMDFLDIRASIPGYKAFRNQFDGSYLILYLCKELMTEYLSTNQDTKDLVNVLLNVQRDIISLNITLGLDKDEIEAKQTIEWRACLSDKIAFKKAEKRGLEKTVLIPEQKLLDTKDWLTTITSTLNTILSFSKSN